MFRRARQLTPGTSFLIARPLAPISYLLQAVGTENSGVRAQGVFVSSPRLRAAALYLDHGKLSPLIGRLKISSFLERCR
jgi:hypothetical protein